MAADGLGIGRSGEKAAPAGVPRRRKLDYSPINTMAKKCSSVLKLIRPLVFAASGTRDLVDLVDKSTSHPEQLLPGGQSGPSSKRALAILYPDEESGEDAASSSPTADNAASTDEWIQVRLSCIMAGEKLAAEEYALRVFVHAQSTADVVQIVDISDEQVVDVSYRLNLSANACPAVRAHLWRSPQYIDLEVREQALPSDLMAELGMEQGFGWIRIALAREGLPEEALNVIQAKLAALFGARWCHVRTPTTYSAASWTRRGHGSSSEFAWSLAEAKAILSSSPQATLDSPLVLRRQSPRLQQPSPRDGALRLSDFILHVDDPKARPLFAYPEGAPDSVLVTENELRRLDPGVFLNDTLVDLDLRCTIGRLAADTAARLHCFSSFFFEALSAKSLAGEEGVSAAKRAHRNVAKWTAKVNIFERDLLVVPINEHLHWYVAFVFHPGAILRAADDVGSAEAAVEDSQASGDRTHSRCSIVIYDSLGVARPTTIRRLKDYMEQEAVDKLQATPSMRACSGYSLHGPQQPNLSDCGLFMLHAIEQLVRDPDFARFGAQSRDADCRSWFAPQDAIQRRGQLRAFIRQLVEQHTAKGTLLSSAAAEVVDSASSDLEIIEVVPNK